VKGVHLEGLRVVGRPELFAGKYYEDGADELIYIDSVASLYGRNNLEEIVRRTAERVFIPLTVGGGVRSVNDIERLLRAGADKVAINTAALTNNSLLSEGARVFGSQCIVLSVQAKQRSPGKYECLVCNAREETGLDVFEWIKKAADLGAGEILLMSVDREGTGKGYDIELIARAAGMVDVPVIASGGAGRPEHIKEAIELGMADAVSAASIFHYGLVDYMSNTGDYSDEGNIDFLKKRLPLAGHERKGIRPIKISELKKYLGESGILCRV
jgi:cyclase